MKRQESMSIQRLREELKKANEYQKKDKLIHFLVMGCWLEGAHIANPILAMRYFTKTEAQGALLVSLRPESSCLISDDRYKDRVKNDAKVLRYGVISQGSYLAALKRKGIVKPGEAIGYDDTVTSGAQEAFLPDVFADNKIYVCPGLIEYLSSVKDEEELSKTKEAIRLAEGVFRDILLPEIENSLKTGKTITTLDLQAIIAAEGARQGAENLLSIILIGEHSCYMHGKTGDKNWKSRIERSDVIVFNWGYVIDGLFSDITRAVMIGNPKTKEQRTFRDAYRLTVEAKKAMIEVIKPGIKAKLLGDVARSFTEKTDGRYKFVSLGHGMGIKIHNYPHIMWKSKSCLSSNQVISLEPGILLPGIGCARVGGQVRVTEIGCEDMSSLDEDLIIIE